MKENERIVSSGETEASRAIILGSEVYDPAVFHQQLFKFSKKQYQFLNHYRLGVPLPEAALKAGLTPDAADRFLAKPETQAWLADRALMQHIKTEWEEPGRWWKMGNEVLEGRRLFTKAQVDVWHEFGRRIAPLPAEGHAQGTKIEINIDPAAVQEAFRRQKALEAEAVEVHRDAA